MASDAFLEKDEMSGIVSRITTQLRLLQDERQVWIKRQYGRSFELSDAQQQLVQTRSQFRLLQGGTAVFLVAKALPQTSWVPIVHVLLGVALLSLLVYGVILDTFWVQAEIDPVDLSKVLEVPRPKGRKTGKPRSSSASYFSLESFLPRSTPECIERLHDMDGEWENMTPAFENSEPSMRVWHRQAGGPFHSFKFDVTLPSVLPPIFAIAKELDMMPIWNPFVARGMNLTYSPPTIAAASSDPAGREAKVRGYIEVKLPWPLRNIAILAQIRVFDALDEDGSVIVVIGSEDETTMHGQRNSQGSQSASSEDGEQADGEEPAAKRVPTTPQECPRMWLRVLAQASPKSLDPPGQSRMMVMAKVRFPVPHTPHFIIRAIIRTMAPLVVSRVGVLIRRHMSDPESDFCKKMRSDKVLYTDLLTDKVQKSMGVSEAPLPAAWTWSQRGALDQQAAAGRDRAAAT